MSNFFFPVFDIVFDFWFAILISQAARMKSLIAMYVILAGMRIYLIFSPEPLPSFAIPEPASTLLFIMVGLILGAFFVFRFAWSKIKEI